MMPTQTIERRISQNVDNLRQSETEDRWGFSEFIKGDERIEAETVDPDIHTYSWLSQSKGSNL